MKGLLTRYCPGMLAEKGSGAIEYGLLIAGIVLLILMAVNSLGQKVSELASLIQN
jgi:Flp pilus assembly pilin Flp